MVVDKLMVPTNGTNDKITGTYSCQDVGRVL